MKRKKVYYLPGMISLIGLPFLVWIFLVPHHTEQYRTYSKPIRLFIPSDHRATGWVRDFSKYAFLRDIRRKKILEVDLNETWSAACDTLLRCQKKALIIQKMSELQFLHDTTTVLKIAFGNDNTYGDFMWLLDLAHKFMFSRYAFFDNSFYFLGNPRPAPTPKDTTQKIGPQPFGIDF